MCRDSVGEYEHVEGCCWHQYDTHGKVKQKQCTITASLFGRDGEDVLVHQCHDFWGVHTFHLSNDHLVLFGPHTRTKRFRHYWAKGGYAQQEPRTLNTKNSGLQPSCSGRPSFISSVKMEESA